MSSLYLSFIIVIALALVLEIWIKYPLSALTVDGPLNIASLKKIRLTDSASNKMFSPALQGNREKPIILIFTRRTMGVRVLLIK